MSNKKNELSIEPNKNEIVWDIFGRTDAPNWHVDDFNYFTDGNNHRSIYKKLYFDYQTTRQIYPNREVKKRNYEHRKKLKILHEILQINSEKLLTCKYYNKYKKYLRSLNLNRFKYIVHFFFAWQNTPCRATSSDWKKICAESKNQKYIDKLHEIILQRFYHE